MEKSKIKKYFMESVFDESLVLLFHHNTIEKRVVLVCNYAHNAVQAVLEGRKPPLYHNGVPYHRDLRKLVFDKVENYFREPGGFKGLWQHKDHFVAVDHKHSVVTQRFDVQENIVGDKFDAYIDFGAFGSCSFTFSSLDAHQKFARAIKKEASDSWVYVDAFTLDFIDFYHPFDIAV